MKKSLAFLTSDDFESFTSMLLSEELLSFQAVEGAGGDGGLDGIDGETMYQMYFPETKNRDKKHYIAKIDKDLAKLQKTMSEKNLTITRWILVVPDDLSADVVLHLQSKTKETNIECLYRGATQLTVMVDKHPHIKKSFPTIFANDLEVEIDKIIKAIDGLRINAINAARDILKESEYQAVRKRLGEEAKNKLESLTRQYPTANFMQLGQAVNKEYAPKHEELGRRYSESMQLYELEVEDTNRQFDELVTRKNSEYQARGLYHSGLREADIQKIELARTSALKRLHLIFGKVDSDNVHGFSLAK